MRSNRLRLALATTLTALLALGAEPNCFGPLEPEPEPPVPPVEQPDPQPNPEPVISPPPVTTPEPVEPPPVEPDPKPPLIPVELDPIVPEVLIYQPGAEEMIDLWLETYRSWSPETTPATGRDDEELQIGSDGLAYSNYMVVSLLKFESVFNLPPPSEVVWVKLELFCHEIYPAEAFDLSVGASRILEPWDIDRWDTNPDPEIIEWPGTPPTSGNGSYHLVSNGEWVEIDITHTYQDWWSGQQPNYGLALTLDPFTSGGVAYFRSSDHADKKFAPRLKINRGINLKLPLPGGKSWLLTTEAGGGDCAGTELDWWHIGNNFYSLDFAPINKETGWESDVPVYAAADGKVKIAEYQTGGGYYIALEHDQPYDDNLNTGFSTWYLHLQAPFMVAKDDKVIQGQQIGIMGNSGEKTTGTHLHFGVRYNGYGEKSTSQLERVRLEGLPLKDYLTECLGGVRTKYYPSTNTP